VSIAVWMSDVHPSYTSTYPAATGPEPRAPSADVRLVAPPPTAPAATWGVGLALGLGGSIDGPRAAADALAGGWVRLARSRTALRAELEAQSRRQVTLQTGHGEWRRWALGIGIERTLSAGDDGSGWLRGFATARLAVLQLEGVGFAVNHSSQAVDPGAAAGLCAVWRRGSWASWIEAALSLWPVGHEAVAADEAQRLPVFEGFLRVGAGWGAAR
jgi:hypothetical protein